MRPLPYGSRKPVAAELAAAELAAASMRPLPYGSGKSTITAGPSRTGSGFNEAAPLRKRKVTKPLHHRPLSTLLQ